MRVYRCYECPKVASWRVTQPQPDGAGVSEFSCPSHLNRVCKGFSTTVIVVPL
jgi:hypothetical protein